MDLACRNEESWRQEPQEKVGTVAAILQVERDGGVGCVVDNKGSWSDDDFQGETAAAILHEADMLDGGVGWDDHIAEWCDVFP
mmetsp:Transcript_4218/g.9076  ORF Transcript_4218/g.9076 Transcript_4218/m.9076 type:complete len:83 (+) Transcript_4218:6175-6423(+)